MWLKGNIHHSVCRWVLGDIPLDKLAAACTDMGIEAIDLLDEKDWDFVNKAGLKCSMGNVTDYGITKGFNRLEYHDKQCCKTSWASALCEMVGSERLKILYDIYHMQIMEGNIVDTIKKYHKYIGHYHTDGVPGRHEIDETQELYYPAIMRAIVKTGYKGYVAHEFIPLQEEKMEALRKGVALCDV